MAVEENPILYDHNHSHYRNPEKKIETWSMLKDLLNYVGDTQELADYWKIVRDRYTKARRKAMMKKPTKFKFLNECSFLNPHITERSSWYEKPIDCTDSQKSTKPSVTDSNFYSQLIRKVKDNPCFYDSNDYYYRRFQYKVGLWETIAKELKFDGTHQDMYKQWKKLRDRYVREIRKLKVSGKSKENCKWEFFQAMDWMELYIEEQRPLEEFEGLVNGKEDDLYPVRTVRPVKQRPRKSATKPPTLQKMTDDEITDEKVIKQEENQIPEDSASSSSESQAIYEEPIKKRRFSTPLEQSNTTLQQQPTQYVYYLTTAGSQVQLIDPQGRVISTTGHLIQTPNGQILNVVQQPQPTQYIISQPPSQQFIPQQTQFVPQESYSEPVDQGFTNLQPVSMTSYAHEDYGEAEGFFDNHCYEETDMVSTESLADDLHSSTVCEVGMDIPENFLADEDDQGDMGSLNEPPVGVINYDFVQDDRMGLETMPESFLALS
ncbi:hypothetical protein FO519_006518 [Halicephalobus sp. NKZ332]|nr:hypothetical protein FO519_006518 [Halicephalobus sp. NKZ332]